MEDQDTFPDSSDDSSEKNASEKNEEIGKKRRTLGVNKFFHLGAGLGAALVVCVFLAYFIDARLTSGRVVSGVRMAGIDLSRLSAAEAGNKLHGISDRLNSRTLGLKLRREVCALPAARVAVRLDTERSVTRAFAVGRDGSALSKFGAWFGRFLRPLELAPALTLNRKELGLLLGECEAKALSDRPFQGGFKLQGSKVTPDYPRAGHGINVGDAERRILEALGRPEVPASIELAAEVIQPQVSRAEVDRIVTETQRAIERELIIKRVDQQRELRLSSSQIATLLTARRRDDDVTRLELACDESAVEKLLTSERSRIEDAPENAKFVVNEKDEISIVPSVRGTRLTSDEAARAMLSALNSPNRSAEVRVEPGAEPDLTTDTAQKLGVSKLVSSFTTRHACCESRVKNIHRIADLLDGVVVRPGQTFSVNELIGPRTTKNGFVPAPTIEEGEMVDTIGGGASQFATTFFNAIYFGGYDIVERQPHSYWFTRYPMGRDATLSYPKPDLIFRNDTDAGVLIKTAYTDTSITVKLYGNNGGRKVRDEVSARQNIVKPEVELIPNRGLEPDREQVKDGGMVGWSVVVRRLITFADGTTREDRRKVTYKPRVRRVEVHPCRIPEGEKGYTGDPCPEPKDVETAAN